MISGRINRVVCWWMFNTTDGKWGWVLMGCYQPVPALPLGQYHLGTDCEGDCGFWVKQRDAGAMSWEGEQILTESEMPVGLRV